MTSKTTTFVTSISAIGLERYVDEQTDEKKMILYRNALSERRYRRFRLHSDYRTCCQNKQMGDSERMRLVFDDLLQQLLHFKVNNYPLTKINRFITLGT